MTEPQNTASLHEMSDRELLEKLDKQEHIDKKINELIARVKSRNGEETVIHTLPYEGGADGNGYGVELTVGYNKTKETTVSGKPVVKWFVASQYFEEDDEGNRYNIDGDWMEFAGEGYEPDDKWRHYLKHNNWGFLAL